MTPTSSKKWSLYQTQYGSDQVALGDAEIARIRSRVDATITEPGPVPRDDGFTVDRWNGA